MLSYITIISILIITLLLVQKFRTQNHHNNKPEKQIPILPNERPIIGHLTTVITYPFDYHLGELSKNFQKLKSDIYMLKAPHFPKSEAKVLTTNPEIVKHITSTKFESIYVKGNQHIYQQLLGSGIFNSNGEQWKKHRKAAVKLFHTSNLRNYIEIFDKNSDLMITKLKSLKNQTQNERTGVDMQDYFMRYTLDSFCEIAFGISLHSINEEINHFAIAFDATQTQTVRKLRFGALFFLIKMFNPIENIEQQFSYINEIVNNMIHFQNSQSDEMLETRSDVLSSIILKGRKDKENAKFSNEDLRDFIVNFLIAGRFVFTQSQRFFTEFFVLIFYYYLCQGYNCHVTHLDFLLFISPSSKLFSDGFFQVFFNFFVF